MLARWPNRSYGNGLTSRGDHSMNKRADPAEPSAEGAAVLPDWRAMLDASPVASLFFTPDLVLLHCNAAHTRNSGVSPEALRGRYMFDVWPKNPAEDGPDTEDTIRASVARCLETGASDEPPIQKHDLPRAGGGFDPRYWRIVHSPVVQNGATVAIRQDSWDVTAAVLELERQETLQRVAGQLAGIAFWELDVAADRIVHTPEFDVLFGFPPDDATGKERPFSTYAQRFHEDDRQMIDEAIEGLLREGQGGVRQFAYRVVRPDGEIRNALVRGEVSRDNRGRTVLTGITFDVTELHAKEERLAALVAEKEALLGEVNHRVKNSLQLVSAILSMEARRAGPSEGTRLRSAAARVQSVAAVHASLYHGRDVGRIEMGAHLRGFCERLADSLGAEARGIEIVVDAAETVLSSDKGIPVSLIVNELVTNAFKHAAFDPARRPARVSVTLSHEEGGQIVLSVSDTGSSHGTESVVGESVAIEGRPGTQNASAGGLGSKLIDALVRQIGGRLVQERENGWSTRIEFEDRTADAPR
jgi:PAS domain S-box-containing protein